jgi:hypothetical protein
MSYSKRKFTKREKYGSYSAELQSKFGVINIYRKMLKDGKIKKGGSAHNRMNKLYIQIYEESSKKETA